MEMKRKYVIALLAALLLVGCQKDQWDDCFTSTGPNTLEERSVADFYAVELNDRVDLVLEQRAVGSIAVEAGNNLLDQVETSVVDGWLTIRNHNSCNWVRSFKPRITVKVPADQVAFLMLRGTGNVSTNSTITRSVFRVEQNGAQGSAVFNLDVDTCYAGLHTGAGNVTYSGSTTVAYLYSGAMAPIDAMGLNADVTLVNNSGVADIRCQASVYLDAQIYGVGDVYYSGEPSITSQLVGTGQLIKVD